MAAGCHPAWVNRRAWIQMGVLAALWGASYMFIKVSLDDVSPIVVVWVRLVLAALVLLPIAHRRGALAALRPHKGTILLLSVVQVAAPFLLITFGEKHIASALAGILVASAPIFTALLAFWVDREELATGWALVGIVVGIVGVALLFGVDLSGDSAALLGGLMVPAGEPRLRDRTAADEARLQGVPPVGTAAATMTLAALAADPGGAVRVPDARAWPRHRRLAARPRRRRDRRRVPHLLHADRRDRPGPRDGRRLHRARRSAWSTAWRCSASRSPRGTRGRPAWLILAGSWLGASGRPAGGLSRSGPSRSSAPAPARAR